MKLARTNVVLVYDAATRAYAPADGTAMQGRLAAALSNGSLVHLARDADAVKSTVSGPFRCDGCAVGVPVLIVVTHGAIADAAWQHPAWLRRDAASAWAAYERYDRAGVFTHTFSRASVLTLASLYRYLADTCRLGRCEAAFDRVEDALKGRSSEEIPERMHRQILFDGYLR